MKDTPTKQSWKDGHKSSAEYIKSEIDKMPHGHQWLVRYAYGSGVSMGLEWAKDNDTEAIAEMYKILRGEDS